MAAAYDDATNGMGAGDIAITKELRSQLKAELRRTGVTAIMLLKDFSDLPDGLSARCVNRWMSGLVQTAPRENVEYVQARWARLPDDPGRTTSDGRRLSKRGARHPVDGEAWIEVTPEMIAVLRADFSRTGVSVAGILRNVEAVPDGLTQRVVRGWYHGEIGRAKHTHWRFIAELLAAEADHPIR